MELSFELAIRMPRARWGSPHLSARKAASWRFSFRLSTLHAAWTDATLRLSPTARRPLIGQPDPDAGAGGALLGNQMVSQVKDEVFYTGLIVMQELDLPEGLAHTRTKAPPSKHKVVGTFPP